MNAIRPWQNTHLIIMECLEVAARIQRRKGTLIKKYFQSPLKNFQLNSRDWMIVAISKISQQNGLCGLSFFLWKIEGCRWWQNWQDTESPHSTLPTKFPLNLKKKNYFPKSWSHSVYFWNKFLRLWNFHQKFLGNFRNNKTSYFNDQTSSR